MTGPAGGLPEPSVERVGDGLYAYIQLDGSWWLNNTGFIEGDDHVVLIDTCATEARSRAMLAALRGVTPKPVRTLVSTHHHGDHTHGNYLVEGATRIGHERCRQRVIEWGVSTSNPLFPTVDWGHLELAPPEVTFSDRLDVFVGDLRLELHHVGPAHTDNDVLVWLPERGVLYAGDLVFNGGTPFVVMGSVSGAIGSIDQIRALGPEVIVPGHGSVCGADVLDPIEEYLRFVQDTAAAAKERGQPPLAAAEEARGRLGRFGEWHDAERLAGNIHRAYAEIDGAAPGEPLNYQAVFGDMIAWNGGQLPRCLA
jgi:cyclase